MCCFAGAGEVQVHGTTIFARLVAPGTQVLAYQMAYAAKAPTAMLLPLPVALPAKEGSVRFKNLKEYPDFFDALATGFPSLPKRSWSKRVEVPASATLEVHDVGDFVASFVPRIADFARVDPRFVLAPSVWTKLPAYADYGFAIFQLKELSGSPHPIALEFDSRLPDQLFFPTVHIHDGSVHDKDRFDHVLYAQASAFDAHVGDYDGPSSTDRHTGFVRSQGKVADFADIARAQGLLAAELLVHKVSLRGLLPNQDTLFGVSAAAVSKNASAAREGQGNFGACSRCAVSVRESSVPLPLELTLAGLGWSLVRRNHRRREKQD
jgi:hypothetical protein